MLNHLKIASAKPGSKPYALYDSDGLLLFIQNNGSKLWRFRYRYCGRQKTLHIGRWPDIPLADARLRRDEARRQVAAGKDPAQLKIAGRKAAKIAAANTFRAIAEEWYAKCVAEKLAPITLRKIRWLLDIAYPTLRSMAVAEITPPDCLTVLRKLEGSGRRESARRMRSVLGRVFRYAIQTGRLAHNPAFEARDAKEAEGKVGKRPISDQRIDARLACRVGRAAKRERDRPQAELEQAIAACGLEIILPLRRRAADQLDLTLVQAEPLVGVVTLRLDRAIVGQQDTLRAAFDDRRRDAARGDVGNANAARPRLWSIPPLGVATSCGIWPKRRADDVARP